MPTYLTSKKAAEFLPATAILMVVAIIAGSIMVYAAQRYASGEADAMLRHAREIALLIESASIAQQNFIIAYPYDLHAYNVKITNKEAQIYLKNPGEDPKVSEPLVTSLNQYFSKNFIHPEHLYFGKVEGSITIDDKPFNFNKLPCPSFPANSKDWQKNSMAVHMLDKKNAFFLALLKEPIHDQGFSVDFSTFFIEPTDEQQPFAAAAIALAINDNNQKYIKIFYDHDRGAQAAKLGCLILNQAAESLNISTIALIPIASTQPHDLFPDLWDSKQTIPVLGIAASISPADAPGLALAFKKATAQYFITE